MDYDYTHPENFYKDLIYLPEGKTTEESREKEKLLKTSRVPPDTNIELCWSCGWNTYHQETSSYGSRIRVFHTRGNMGLWTLGSQLMILDQPNNSLIGNDYITQEFIRNQPGLKQNIPLVEKMQSLSAPTDQIHFTLMSRAQGERLDLVWVSHICPASPPISRSFRGGVLRLCLESCLGSSAPSQLLGYLVNLHTNLPCSPLFPKNKSQTTKTSWLVALKNYDSLHQQSPRRLMAAHLTIL